MQRLMPALATALLAACICADAAAGDVYQWKDAKGVTHYSNTPPASGTYKMRAVHADATPAPAAAPTTASAAPAATPSPATSPPSATPPAEDPGCAIARRNVELLQGDAPVQIDSDGDGKADKTLSAEDRAKHMQLAQSALKAGCAQAADTARK